MTELSIKNRKPKGKKKRVLLIVLAAAVLLSIVVLSVIPPLIMSSFTGQQIYRKVYEPEEFGIQAQSLVLETDDSLRLAAWLVEAQEPKATVIVLSGIENPSVTAFFGYAKMFQENGYNTLLIEMRAHNASEGNGVALGMEEWKDVKAGVDYLAGSEYSQLPVVAMGTSMGGATVNVAAGEIPEIAGVISVSAYSSWKDVFADTMVQMGLPRFLAAMEKPFVNLYLGLYYGIDKVKYTPVRGMEQIGDRPVLLMHSTQDSEVPYPSFEKLLRTAEKVEADVTVFLREGDEHFIVYDQYFETPWQDAEFSGAVLEFLSRYFS